MAVSITVGTQYALRLAIPPSQVELPLVSSDVVVLLASVPVLPKNACR